MAQPTFMFSTGALGVWMGVLLAAQISYLKQSCRYPLSFQTKNTFAGSFFQSSSYPDDLHKTVMHLEHNVPS